MGVSISSILYQPYEGHLSFFCPGCLKDHTVRLSATGQTNWWSWNHDITDPSFELSIKVEFTKITEEGRKLIEAMAPLPTGVKRYPCTDEICHSWVTNGNIRFFDDSTHNLAGKTVPLIPHRHKP